MDNVRATGCDKDEKRVERKRTMILFYDKLSITSLTVLKWIFPLTESPCLKAARQTVSIHGKMWDRVVSEALRN